MKRLEGKTIMVTGQPRARVRLTLGVSRRRVQTPSSVMSMRPVSNWSPPKSREPEAALSGWA